MKLTTHWRILIATILALMAAIWLAPRLIPAPELREHRVLAPAPAWPRSPGELGEFRKAADAWIADRFPPRAHFIGALNDLRMKLGVSGSARVIVGRDGWLFYNDGSNLGVARADPAMTDQAAREWLSAFAGRSEALRAKGVTYLLVIPPTKEAIYPEMAPAWYGRPSPRRPARRLAALAEQVAPGGVIYLGPAVQTAKAGGLPAFSRHDTHWTGQAAYFGYVALMERLRALGVAVEPPRPLSSFVRSASTDKPRDLAQMLGVATFVPIAYDAYEDPPVQKAMKTAFLTERADWTAPQVIDTGQAGKPVLLMTRDSYSNALTPYLYGHFSRLILTHIDDGTWRPDLVERFHPDVVLLEAQENGAQHIMAQAPPASPAALARIEAALAGRAP